MTHKRSQNDDMTLSDWYNNYLMKYVTIISKPTYSTKQQVTYNDILLRWYGNWSGYMKEIK